MKNMNNHTISISLRAGKTCPHLDALGGIPSSSNTEKKSEHTAAIRFHLDQPS